MNKGNLTLLGAVIISLMIICAAAHADIINPDPFERYTPTTNWQPTAIADGWSRAPWSNEYMTAAITATGGYLGTKGLSMGGDWVSGMLWHILPDITILPHFVLRYEFRCVLGEVINLNGLNTSYSGTGYPVMIQTTPDYCRMWHKGETTPEATTDLPGGFPAFDTWYTLELEHDYTTAQGRARYGPAGGTFNDWTDWKPMSDPAQPTMLVVQGVNMDFDNFEIPGAMVGATIAGTVALADYVGDASLMPVLVELKKDGVVQKTTTVYNNGTFSFVALSPATYQVVINSGKSLSKAYTRTVTWGDYVDLGATTLVNGDVNGDNQVDTVDFSILSGNSGQVGD